MPRLLVVCSCCVLLGCETLDSGNASVSGMLMGPPLGWTTATQRGIQVKAPGFSPGPVTPLPPGVPLVKFDAFVPRLLENLTTTESPLLAMSLGIDVISTAEVTVDASNLDPPDPTWTAGKYPVLRVGNHGWYAIGFTVDSDQIQGGDDLAPDIVPAPDRDTSVFCYLLPASYSDLGGQYVLPGEIDSTRILEPAHLGITKATDELHAINMHIGLYQTDLAIATQYTQRELPTEPNIFFTLRPEFIADVGAQVLAPRLGVSVDEVTPGTIFVSHWTAGQWSMPTKFRTAAELGIDEPGTAVIDGLAIDTLASPGPEVLFSLRHTGERTVEPEDQIMHTTAATAVSKPPRRVVVAIDGKYGSLGRHMRAGRAIGDFCTADPWLPDPDFKYYTATGPKIPEDFEFARRKPDPRVGPTRVVLPISAMRAWNGRETVVRVCMATPRRLPGERARRPPWVRKDWGTVKLYQGYTNDVTVGNPNSEWKLVAEFPAPGEAFHHDFRLVPDAPPAAAAAAATSNAVRGIIARWELHLDGRVWHSPIAALRY